MFSNVADRRFSPPPDHSVPRKACPPPPHMCGLAVGCPRSAVQVTALQTNLAASLQKSLLLLPLGASNPTSVKQRMLRKRSRCLAPAPGMRRYMGTHPMALNTMMQTTHPHTAWDPAHFPPSPLPHLLLILLINELFKSLRNSLLPSLLHRCEGVHSSFLRDPTAGSPYVRSPGTGRQLCLGAELLTSEGGVGGGGWGETHTSQFSHLLERLEYMPCLHHRW